MKTEGSRRIVLLLVILTIAALGVALAVPRYNDHPGCSRFYATLAEISHLKLAVTTFETDTGRYPRTEEGLAALLQPPPDLLKMWRGPYLDSMPSDKWGNPYRYVYPTADTQLPFNIISAGPDGKDGTSDDIDVHTQN